MLGDIGGVSGVNQFTVFYKICFIFNMFLILNRFLITLKMGCYETDCLK